MSLAKKKKKPVAINDKLKQTKRQFSGSGSESDWVNFKLLEQLKCGKCKCFSWSLQSVNEKKKSNQGRKKKRTKKVWVLHHRSCLQRIS